MRLAALFVVVTGCVSAAPLSVGEVRELGARTWSGATDEVFDATWLSLVARGFEVTQHDRLAGTLSVRRDGRDWEIDVAALGIEQRVVLVPTTPVARAELSQVLDGLEEGTAGLLRAWKDVPEWVYDGRRNLLRAAGFVVEPPRDWEWLDFDVSHREVTVQLRRTRTGPNPTLLVELDRTRPESRRLLSAQRTIGLALGARQRLVFPDDLKEGAVRVLDGTTPQDVVWFGREETQGALQVRVTLACPKADETFCQHFPLPSGGERVRVRGGP